MLLSDISVKRPVFASVLSLLLVAFGVISFQRLSLREYPDIDPPVVSIETRYVGAAATVVETRITKVIEERIAGIEGIDYVESTSEDGRSSINIRFDISRDIDSAANDIRDRVSGILDDLPVEAEPPEIQKVDSNEDVIMWLNLASDDLTLPELSDYAERYLVDRFSVLDGVARVRVGGSQRYAMRVWIDRNALAARGLTVADVENALRQENVELPAGNIESIDRQFTVRLQRGFRTPEDFKQIVLSRGDDGYLVRLSDVARVERGTEENRTFLRGNGVPMVGLGIIKQSTANTIAVARAARAEMDRLNETLPEGMAIRQSYDTSVFIEGAIKEVYGTLFIAIILVVIVIFLFLGSFRAMLVPAVAVPVSIVATFTVLYALNFSVNLFTLLALVLAIGLVVDDAIVVLENVYRRMQEYGETPLVAAFRGTREVGFAVIATTLVLVAVFVPIAFLEGDIGRLFSEFAITMAAAVCFSSLIALSLSPMIASKILKQGVDTNKVSLKVNSLFESARHRYHRILERVITHPIIVTVAFFLILPLTAFLMYSLPSEYAPREDRGAFFVMVNGPEGASYSYMEEYMNEIEERLMRYIEKEEATRLLVRAPRSFGNTSTFNSGLAIFVLNDWAQRRSAWLIMDEVRDSLKDLPGVRANPVMRQGFGSSIQKPVQFVIGGGTYQELAEWRDIILEKLAEDNPGFDGIDWDYKETKPQIEVVINYDLAAELGVQVTTIGTALETMLGSRRVTTFVDAGEEYDVIVEGERDVQRTPTDMQNIYVRSQRSGELLPLASFVTLDELADSNRLNRFNRVRAINIEANLLDDYALGDALSHLEGLVREHLPATATIDYKGQSRDFKFSGASILFVFFSGILVVYLVLAAQFESYLHPFIILLTVPLAISGGLLGLYVTGSTLNLYSQIGLVMLVGIATKNGILIVEFINQLRDKGVEFNEAILEASSIRLRPIIMTAITTAAGAIPLILASGPGSETRKVIGIVVFAGVLAATFFTLIVVPVAYRLLAKGTGSPGDVARQLEEQSNQTGTSVNATEDNQIALV